MGSPPLTAACFDSDVIIDYLQGLPAAVGEMALYAEHHLSIVSWIEVMTGAIRRGRDAEVRQFLTGFHVHDLNQPIAEAAFVLRARHRLRTPDASIWATAIHLRLTLVTRNTRDFPVDDPGIRVPYRL